VGTVIRFGLSGPELVVVVWFFCNVFQHFQGESSMFPQFEFSDQILMFVYLAITIIIPGIVMLGDDAKMRQS
jgi:hypothetical protein